MNYIKKQELLQIQSLATGIGHFIRYWGFRKIHGEVWTIIYLAKKPVSGVEVSKTLQVSKALVSLAIKELESERLIQQTKSENSKTKRYCAEEDVVKIIHGILNRREKPMLDEIEKSHISLMRGCKEPDSVNLERLQKMGSMIQLAQLALASLLQTGHILDG